VVTGAPPTAKPINIKVRGEDPLEIRRAADQVIALLREIPAVLDITDDDVEGSMELSVRLNPDAIIRAGLNPATVIRDIRLLTDGEIVASMQDRGEKVEVRVRARPEALKNIENFLQNTIGLPDGRSVVLGQLLHYEIVRGKANIRHYKLRRTITVEAELNKEMIDTVAVNRLIQRQWAERFSQQFPTIDLEFTGELDDIQESLDALAIMFLFGIGLIYIVLATQFKSYIQPLIIIFTIPMALMGVIFGLLVSGDPLNVYTMYSVVALAGVAVAAAIILISCANELVQRGMSVLHATVYSARHRVTPILITALTTIDALLALAFGWGGKSLIWGPLANANVWGLGLSTLLTLFVIPLLYNCVVKPVPLATATLPLPRPLPTLAGSPLGRLLAQLRLGPLSGANRTEQYAALDAIAVHPELRAIYNNGREKLIEKDYEQAIRLFEKATREAPDNSIFYVCAAQALILYMREQIGWDIGYMERVRRCIIQATRLAPGDKRIPLLRKAYDELAASAPEQ
jgi:multidrug efflux pump subunit AcrB